MTAVRDPKSGKFTPSSPPSPVRVAADLISDEMAPEVEAVGTRWSYRGITDTLVGYETALAWDPAPDPAGVEPEPLPEAQCPTCRHAYWSLDTQCTGVLSEDRTEMLDHPPALVRLVEVAS
jgi:hypothetical protein